MSSQTNVLVADDDPGITKLLKLLLQREGYSVATASNGLEAWEQATERPFDLVVTDYEMPELNGVELCRKLRSTPAYRDVPMILITASSVEPEIKALASALRLNVRNKPLNPAIFVDELRRLAELPTAAAH